MITTQIELDVSPGGIAPVIHVSQYDTGSRTLQFNLIATAGDLILPTGTKAEIRGTKPDGNGFSYDALINGKTVTADVTEQMTAAAGKAVCEIVLYTGMPAREDAEASSDFTQLCTANFILFVERAALDKDTVRSGSEIKQLINVIDRTDELLAAAETMDDAKESIRQMTENTRSEMNQLAQSIEQNAQDLADQSAASARAAAQSAQAANRTLETVEAKGQQISQIALNSDTLARTALEKATNAENESAETANAVDNINRSLARLNLLTQGKVDDAYVEDKCAFYYCSGITAVNMQKVKTIRNDAFQYCTALTDFTLPDTIEYIYGGAFRNCTSLTKMVFPAGLKRLDSNVFTSCTGMKKIIFLGRPTTLYNDSLAGMANLEDVYIPWRYREESHEPWGTTNATIHYIDEGWMDNLDAILAD